MFDLRNQLQLRVDILTTRLFRLLHASERDGVCSQPLSRLLPQSAKPDCTVPALAGSCVSSADAQLKSVGLVVASVSRAAADAQAGVLLAAVFAAAAGAGRAIVWPGVSRESIMRRGESYEIWVRNVRLYSNSRVAQQRNWGLLVNTTWRHRLMW